MKKKISIKKGIKRTKGKRKTKGNKIAGWKWPWSKKKHANTPQTNEHNPNNEPIPSQSALTRSKSKQMLRNLKQKINNAQKQEWRPEAHKIKRPNVPLTRQK